MTRVALAAVLSLSFPYFAAAQHRSEGGPPSSPPSSGSSASSSGGGYSGGGSANSGGSSSGYSGGSSHSSSSSSSGSSGSYSGGSSHSSGSSSSGGSGSYSGGGNHGGSHSSGPDNPGRSGGYSGGSSSGSHSGGNSSPSHPGSGGNPNSGSRDNSPRSNMRTASAGFEHPSGGSSSSNPALGSNSSSGGASRPYQDSNQWRSNIRGTVTPETWMRAPATLDLPTKDLNVRSVRREFDSKLQAVGLEPSKSAFRERIAVSGGGESRHVSWLSRVFGRKPVSASQTAAPQLRPCFDKECKPFPVPPKPCVGSKCPPAPQPLPPPVGAVCQVGYLDQYGNCQPWGYVERCANNPYRQCNVRFSLVDEQYCWRILQEIQRQNAGLNQLRFQRSVACSNPQSQDCVTLTSSLNDAVARVRRLEQQYQLCRASASDPSSLP